MIHQRSLPGDSPTPLGPIIGLVAVGLVLLVGASQLSGLTSDELGALIVFAALLVVTVPLAIVLGRLDDDRGYTRLLLAAFLVKMFGAYIRYTVLKEVYGGGDADGYYAEGLQLAEQFEQGVYPFGEVSGTRFIEIVSGFSYTVLPESQLAGFVLFSWMAFLGLILFSRAIRIGLPDADHRRYDLLVFFLPTIVFWPSSLGKEAWMVTMLGLASYGAAKVLTHRPSGLVPLALGLWGATIVRPHLALMVVAALGPAWLVRSSGKNRLGLSPYFRAIGFGVLMLVLLVVVARAETFFGIERLDAEGAQSVATNTEERTSQGGSEFENEIVESPTDLPRATVTILFRPFVWEVSSGQGLVTAGESMVLLGLMVLSWRQLRALPRTMLRNPYVLYCVMFTLVFIVAYSSFNNFGLLVRQRTQMFPFFLVLLTPLLTRADEDEGNEGATVPTRKPARPHASPTVRGRTRRGSFQPAERPV